MSVKRIKKIDPVQAGKVTAIVLVALMLIIFVPIMLLVSSTGLNSSSLSGGLFAGGSVLVLVILIPIIYGFFGFIIGMLYAAIYNVTYNLHGGLKLEYADDSENEFNNIGR